MNLAIIRHGKAERYSESGSDRDRALTGRGRRQVEYLARCFDRGQTGPDLIFASPFLRTQQTATILAEALNLPIEYDDRLICDAPVSAALDLLAEIALRGRAAFFVGHNPQCEHLVAVLTLGPGGSARRVRTGEAITMTVDPARPVCSAREIVWHRLDESD
jgi:phosphohistidine phosphatase